MLPSVLSLIKWDHRKRILFECGQDINNKQTKTNQKGYDHRSDNSPEISIKHFPFAQVADHQWCDGPTGNRDHLRIFLKFSQYQNFLSRGDQAFVYAQSFIES